MKVQIFAFAFLALLATGYGSLLCPKEDGEDVVILRNWRDCSSFYICSNGRRVLVPCPDGLEFNASERVCDWPERARCKAIPTITWPPSWWPFSLPTNEKA